MKKRKIRFGLSILVLSFMLCITGVFSVMKTPSAKATKIEYVSETVQDFYALGTTFVVPQAKLDIDGNDLDVTKSVLYYPDGRASSADEHVLSNTGEYRLRYFATNEGKTVYADQAFVVKGSLYNVSGTTSSVAYGNSGEEKGNLDGLVVSLASGDVFTYNKAIDLTDKKKADDFVKFYVLPERRGVADVKNVKIRLTDVVDENNYVEIATYANSGDENEYKGEALYSGAKASIHNGYAGMHYKGYTTTDLIYDGNYYSVYKNIDYTSRYGYPSFQASFTAKGGYGETGEMFGGSFNYSVDYKERKIFGYEPGPNANWSNRNDLIADLDDSLFFDQAWKGFTTGEVYLSIYSDMYVNSSFTFVVTDIYDEDLTKVDYEQVNAPQIVIDMPSESVPYAIKNQPYELFKATAYSSCDGEVGCQVLVYRDYYSNSPKLVSVSDGKFIPTSNLTSYSVVYRATDSFGNTAEKIVDIPVKAERLTQIELNENQGSAYTGVNFKLPQPIYSGTNGNYKLSVFVVNGVTENELTPNAQGEYEFYSLTSGEYTIKYVLTDYNGPISVEYTLSVIDNPNPIFYGETAFPEVFVKNAKYVLPEMHGKAFNEGQSTDLKANVQYAFDNGDLVDYTLGSEVKIDAEDTVKLIYSLAGSTEKREKVIPVTDIGLETSKYDEEYDEWYTTNEYRRVEYFYSNEFDGVADTEGLTYTTTEEQARLAFVKPVLTTAFTLEYEFASLEFDTLVFSFVDTCDATNILKIVIKKKTAEKILVTVNDGETRELTTALIGKFHTIDYNSVANTLKIDDYSFLVEGVSDFAKKNAYFSIDAQGLTGAFSMRINKICGQILDKQVSDYAKPSYYLDISDGYKTIGQKIVINGLYFEDVLRFNTTGKLSVLDPNGDYCETVDGITMKNITDFSRKYEIEVAMHGVYSITGSCTDGANPAKIEAQINSYDEVAPVITISETNKNQAVYAGYTYAIASATAVDNLGEKVKVTVIVLDTESKTHVVTNGKFNFARAGYYKVMYRAEDSFGNVGFASYDIVAVDKEA